ncbi:MAG: hypothetical protein QXY70_01125 [Nanopusillaceae archaeon]
MEKTSKKEKKLKGLLIPTFLFIILIFVLVFIVYIMIFPSIQIFHTIFFPIAEEVERGLTGNVSDLTTKTRDNFRNIIEISPYLIVIGFIIAIIIYTAISEIQKRR